MEEDRGFARFPLSKERIGMLEKMCHDAFKNMTGREPVTPFEHATGFMSVACTALVSCIEICDDKEVRDVAVNALAVLERGLD